MRSSGQGSRFIAIIHVVILMVAVSGNAQGQNQWTSLKGPWDAWEPNDIAVGYAGSASYTYAIGGVNRELLVSKDEGDAWTPLPIAEVVAVACVKDQPRTVYVSRQDGSQYTICKSTDGGLNWLDEREFDNPVSKIVISPGSPSVIYAGLGGEHSDVNRPLWRSDDGGANWKESGSLNIYAKITQIVCDPLDPSIIYVASRGTMGGVWKSNDGGVTWFPRNNGITNTQIASLGITPFPRPHVLYAGTFEQGEGDQRIYCSTDGGDHWTVSVSISGATDIAVDPIRTNLVYAATTDGILYTKDSGASWLQRSNGIVGRNGRRIVVMHDVNQHVHVLLGTRAVFYRSDDDGQHWMEKTFGMTLVPCYGVTINTAGMFSIAYGGRGSGSFIHRSVGRGTWNILQDNSLLGSPAGSHFYGFAIAADPRHTNVLLASGTTDENMGQMLFRSSDEGVTWSRVYNADFANQACNIIFDQKDDRFVYTADLYHVLKSSDGGLTWNCLPNSPPAVYSIGIAASRGSVSTTLYAGGSRQVYKSDDGGKTWFSASTGLPGPVISLVCDPVDSQRVYVGTNHHRIYRTTEGGSSWQPCSEGVYGDFIQSMTVNPANRVLYACAEDYYGAPTRVYRSTNLGETWRDISDGLAGVTVYELLADQSNPNAVYCATDQGVFCLQEGNSTFTQTSNERDSPPSTFELSQNYPNPFNPGTTIRFSLQQATLVVLKIFNMAGQEITTLVSDELPAGTYTTHWDAAGIASGLYFYRMTAGSFTEVKRMLVLK